MYEMEEGIGDDESLISESSLDLEEEDYIHEPVSLSRESGLNLNSQS